MKNVVKDLGWNGMKSNTSYKVLLHAKVPKEIRGLSSEIKSRVLSVIDQLAREPIPAAASKLQGHSNCYRIRVGDYRIVYEVHVTEIVVYVVGVAHRREVYRRILRRI